MSNSSIKPYKLTSIDEEEVGSILVFHYTAQQAKVDFWKELDFVEYFDIRIKRLDNFMLQYAKRDTPHVVYNPPFCRDCEHWGIPLDNDGLCHECSVEYSVSSFLHNNPSILEDWKKVLDESIPTNMRGYISGGCDDISNH